MRNKIQDKKQRLLKTSDEYEDLINQDISFISDAAKEWGGRLLVIGGAMVLSYLSVRAILGKKKVKKEEGTVEVRSSRTRARDIVLKSLSDKAALVLLEIAREYIVKLLHDSADKHDR